MPVSRQQNDRRKKLCKVCLKAVSRGKTVIHAPADSCAERYARENKIKFQPLWRRKGPVYE